jgi:hypothetical protein
MELVGKRRDIPKTARNQIELYLKVILLFRIKNKIISYNKEFQFLIIEEILEKKRNYGI